MFPILSDSSFFFYIFPFYSISDISSHNYYLLQDKVHAFPAFQEIPASKTKSETSCFSTLPKPNHELAGILHSITVYYYHAKAWLFLPGLNDFAQLKFILLGHQAR
jgi:hypothetical protein